MTKETYKDLQKILTDADRGDGTTWFANVCKSKLKEIQGRQVAAMNGCYPTNTLDRELVERALEQIANMAWVGLWYKGYSKKQFRKASEYLSNAEILIKKYLEGRQSLGLKRGR